MESVSTGNQTVADFVLLGFHEVPGLHLLFFSVLTIIYVSIITGNMLIVVVVVSSQRLHTPMYFFLVNLSFIEILYTSTVVPKMLEGFLQESTISGKAISFLGCITQLHFFHFLGSTEALLLPVMAFDRFVAICKPLHYSIIMNRQLCIQLAASCWTGGFLNSVVHTVLTFHLPFCGNNQINYFFCDIPPLLMLSCGDTSINELALLSIGIFIGWTPFLCIILSYLSIISNILRIQSSEGRHKAFSTCASHLLIVLLYYGSAIFTYVRPISSYSLEKDRLISVLYSVVTPMLNPVIYTLRNKDIKEAVKTIGRKWQPLIFSSDM
ncbi:Olfactory receptor 5V1 [Lemmus lemmus]